MSDFKAKMRFPDPLAGFKGPTSKTGERKEREGREKPSSKKGNGEGGKG